METSKMFNWQKLVEGLVGGSFQEVQLEEITRMFN